MICSATTTQHVQGTGEEMSTYKLVIEEEGKGPRREKVNSGTPAKTLQMCFSETCLRHLRTISHVCWITLLIQLGTLQPNCTFWISFQEFIIREEFKLSVEEPKTKKKEVTSPTFFFCFVAIVIKSSIRVLPIMGLPYIFYIPLRTPSDAGDGPGAGERRWTHPGYHTGLWRTQVLRLVIQWASPT